MAESNNITRQNVKATGRGLLTIAVIVTFAEKRPTTMGFPFKMFFLFFIDTVLNLLIFEFGQSERGF